MISAKIMSRDGSRLVCRASLQAGAIEISGTNDKVLLVRLHTLFQTPRRIQRRAATGELEVLDLEPKTPLHFASCLEQLDDGDFRVELEASEQLP